MKGRRGGTSWRDVIARDVVKLDYYSKDHRTTIVGHINRIECTSIKNGVVIVTSCDSSSSSSSSSSSETALAVSS